MSDTIDRQAAIEQMTVNICGIPYKIIEKEDWFDTDTHFGQIDYAKAEIRLNKNLADVVKAETLCHEILHGILIYIGREDLSQDETFVFALSAGVNQTFEIKNGGLDGRLHKQKNGTCDGAINI